jgi:exopolysaccharide production protein ExoZ
MPKRIMGLELLRGLCALLVAIYHCLLLSGTAIFPTWGLYGVYVFFGISGAVLYHNYHSTLSGELTIPQFLLRRFARLAPLVWACILVPALVRNVWDLDRYFLSVSLLQGFGSPGLTSYLVGGWSIGIEFVLYALFPTLLAFTRDTLTMIGALVVLLVLRLMFVNYVLDGTDLDHAWGAYIQPAAFLWFFFGGMVLAKVMPQIPHIMFGIGGVLCALALFAFPGASFEAVLLGFRGAVLTVIALVIVGSFFWSPSSAIGVGISRFFGDISYGLYLLHPIVWVASGHYLSLTLPVHIMLTLAVSAGAAWLSFRYYERPVRLWIVRLAR